MIQLNDEIRTGVKNFLESPSGQWYIESLDKLRNHEHNEAEDNPDYSRDHVQRAKGIKDAKTELVNAAIIREKTKTKKI